MRSYVRLLPFGLLLAGLIASCSDESLTGLDPGDVSPELSENPLMGTGDITAFAVSTLSDDFAGTTLDLDRWDLSAPPGRVTVDNRLSVAVAPNTAQALKILYRLPENFQGSSFQTEVSQYASGSPLLGTFAAVTDQAERSYVIFNAFGGQLTAWYRWNGQNPVQLPNPLALNPEQHRYLRLREAAGVVYYETSPNGSSWTVRWSVPHAFPNIAQLHGMLGVQAWGQLSSNPTPAFFENVNTLVPASPRGLTAAAETPLAIQLQWEDRSANETGFRVERRTGGQGVFEEVAALPANATSWEDGGLTAGTSYEYRVQATGTAGASAFSMVASATAQAEPPPPPPPPPGLSSFSDAFVGTVLNLDAWEVVVGADRVTVDNRLELITTPGVNEHTMVRYRLPRSFVGESHFAEISEFSQGSPTTETFIGVITPDQEEYTIMSAWGGQLTAWYKWRDEAYVQLPGTYPLDPVAHRFLRLREAGGTVHYETSPDGVSWTERWTTQHAFVDPTQLYGWVGVGTWGTPNQNPTPGVFENVNTRVPAAPRGATAVPGAPFAIDLSWEDRSVNETGFQVERRVAGTGSFLPVGSTAAGVGTFSDSGLTAGTTYEYRVRATGAQGPSAYSAAASATAEDEPGPPPPPPAMATITDAFVGTNLDLTLWDVFAAPGRVTVDNRLQVAIGAGVVEDSRVRYRLARNLEGSAFQAEVSQFAGGSGTIRTVVGVEDEDGLSSATFRAVGGQLSAWTRWDGQAEEALSGAVALDPVAHRYLRVREDAGAIHFEMSSNGSSWTAGWSVTHAFPDVFNLYGMISVEAGGAPTSAPIPALVENVNTAVPGSPRALQANAGAPLVIELAWEDRSANETGFQLQRRVAGTGSYQTVATLPANTTSHVDSGRTGGTSYEYRVRASGTAGLSAFSNVAAATAAAEPPPPPPPPPAMATTVDAFVGTSLDVTRWETFAAAGRVTVDNRLQIGIGAGVIEDSRVRYRAARNLAGSAFQAEVSQFAGGSATIRTVVGVEDSGGLSSAVFRASDGQLSAWTRWNGQAAEQVAGAVTLDPTAHRYLRVREAAGVVHFETSSNGSSWTAVWSVTHTFPDVFNLYGTIAVESGGGSTSAPTPALVENVNTLVPASPRALQATAGEPLVIELAWEDRSANETGFQLQRRVAGTGSYQTVATLPANTTSYVDSGRVGETTYEYRVRANGAAGLSTFSNVASATAAAEPPPPPPPPPPAVGSFMDTFAGTALDTSRWTVMAPPGRVTVNNDRLILSVAPSTAQALKVMYSLNHDFQGSSFVTEVGQYASGAATLGTFAAVTDAAELSYVIFNAFGGQLTAWYRWNGAAPVQIGGIALNPVAHRFLRLREASGTVYYETSPDGNTWTVRWTVAGNFPNLSALRGMLGVQAWGSTSSNPTPAHFEQVNMAGGSGTE